MIEKRPYLDCKSVYSGSIPLPASKLFLPYFFA